MDTSRHGPWHVILYDWEVPFAARGIFFSGHLIKRNFFIMNLNVMKNFTFLLCYTPVLGHFAIIIKWLTYRTNWSRSRFTLFPTVPLVTFRPRVSTSSTSENKTSLLNCLTVKWILRVSTFHPLVQVDLEDREDQEVPLDLQDLYLLKLTTVIWGHHVKIEKRIGSGYPKNWRL